MKKLFTTALLSVCVLFFSCKKESRCSCNFVKAKVLRYDCDRVILQLLNSSINGDATWTDITTGNTYTNVVSYYNTCVFATVTGGAVTEVYLKSPVVVNEQAIATGCVQCQAISQAPPQTKIDAAEISISGCDDDQ